MAPMPAPPMDRPPPPDEQRSAQAQNGIGRAYLESKRHALLIELAAVEKELGIKPTTAQIREWWRQVNRTLD